MFYQKIKEIAICYFLLVLFLSTLGESVKNRKTRMVWQDFSLSQFKDQKWKLPIPIYFEPSFDLKSKQIIVEALNDLTCKTCLNFNYVQSPPSSGPYVNMKKIAQTSSEKGVDCGGSDGNLGIDNQNGPSQIELACLDRSTVQHEMLHRIGADHTMNRPDRNKFISIKNPDDQEQILKTGKTFGIPYEYNSIMHYDDVKRYTPKKNKKKNLRIMGQSYEPTANDIKSIQAAYCDGSKSAAIPDTDPRCKQAKCFEPDAAKCKEGNNAICSQKNAPKQNPAEYYSCRITCGIDGCKDYKEIPFKDPSVPTTPASTSAPKKPVSTAKRAEDTNPSCCAWASFGECDKNPKFMFVKCQTACGTGGVTEQNFRDYSSNVPAKCKPGKFVPKKSANATTPASTVNGSSTTSPANGACNEANPTSCSNWAAKGECATNPYWMQLQCQKSCQSCGVTMKIINDRAKAPIRPDCPMKNDWCYFWALTGECLKNYSYMFSDCCHACQYVRQYGSAAFAQ